MTIIRNFDQHQKKRISTRYVIFLVAFMGFLVILKILVNNIVFSYGEKMEKNQKLQNALILENSILENEIAKALSLQKVASESQMLGFSGPKSIKYIP